MDGWMDRWGLNFLGGEAGSGVDGRREDVCRGDWRPERGESWVDGLMIYGLQVILHKFLFCFFFNPSSSANLVVFGGVVWCGVSCVCNGVFEEGDGRCLSLRYNTLGKVCRVPEDASVRRGLGSM